MMDAEVPATPDAPVPDAPSEPSLSSVFAHSRRRSWFGAAVLAIALLASVGNNVVQANTIAAISGSNQKVEKTNQSQQKTIAAQQKTITDLTADLGSKHNSTIATIDRDTAPLTQVERILNAVILVVIDGASGNKTAYLHDLQILSQLEPAL